MMIRVRVLMFLGLLAATELAQGQFKVVGYIWSRKNMVQDLRKIDLDKVTHLNIAFINPTPDGDFKDVPGLDSVVQMAHQKNVKVLMSCGGGSSHAYYAKLLTENYRTDLVNKFIGVVDRYNLDGIDVDLEGDDIDTNYEPFVTALRRPLTKRKKLLTSAVAWWTRDRITDLALKQFDYINIMAYDKTGPWKPELPGQHSPVSYVEEHLGYWKNERGLKRHQLNVGLPFYGYGFGELPAKDRAFRQLTWNDVVNKYANRMDDDEIILPDNGGIIYYNGKATIKHKTEIAVKDGGGVMIWQLLYDSFDQNSLLELITTTYKKYPRG